MKQSRNNFPEELRFLFSDCWKCWWCGKNRADSLHHIVGRGNGDSKVESSILNAAPLCNQGCHLPNHGQLRTDEKMREMLDKTYNYLITSNYELTEIDSAFIEKYIIYYI